jgi:hypothetical protein
MHGKAVQIHTAVTAPSPTVFLVLLCVRLIRLIFPRSVNSWDKQFKQSDIGGVGGAVRVWSQLAQFF